MEIKTIIKDNIVEFSHAIAGVLYYIVKVEDSFYQFPVDMNDKDDVGTATFNKTIKAITMMRYIRKALNNNEFIKISKQ